MLLSGTRDFNPRSPRGERLSASSSTIRTRDFNPRSPRGERRNKMSNHVRIFEFQSTLPSRGATIGRFRRRYHGQYFNPRSPRGERRVVMMSNIMLRISIHAPLAGSDTFCRKYATGISNFNPRSPRGERRNSTPRQTQSTNFNPRSPRGERQVRVLYLLS